MASGEGTPFGDSAAEVGVGMNADPGYEPAGGPGVGRSAQAPREIPWRGWWQVIKRVVKKTGESNISLVSAGVGFYGLLALFPGIVALISIYGLVADPAEVDRQFANVSGFLPVEVAQMISDQMQQVASRSDQVLGVGLAGAILIAVWSATKGTRSLITALNIAYDERERRGFFRLNLIAVAATLALVVLAVFAIAAVVGLPIMLDLVGLGAVTEALMEWLRWPLLAAVVLFGLAALYRYGPCRRNARWIWVSWGSVVAMLLWLIASALFSYYVANFASYNATYGSIGAVVIMLMWQFISAFVILLGAVVNAELERQTAKDTTHGLARPMGERGAFVADHLPADSP